MNQYAIYLRKSRADLEAEAHGEGETLARHQTALFALARKLNLSIGAVYREIVSGETISARPVMQQLLSEVRQGLWTGVLVMEVERLARGNTMDQGLVAQSFAFSNTKIITPVKTYDPSNEYDQEYFEFGLFMSRREYMAINRRIQRGRLASVQEGKYVGNTPPYGYERVKLEKQKGYTLRPVPAEADVVSMIYELYVHGEPGKAPIGVSRIARRLNDLRIPPPRINIWTANTVRGLLANPVYIGKIRWGGRAVVKHANADGSVTVSRPRAKPDACTLADGLHPAIVSPEIWEQAQVRLSVHKDNPTPWGKPVQNPLSGLIVCGLCGRKMTRRPSPRSQDIIMCKEPQCSCVGSCLNVIEDSLLKSMEYWIDQHRVELESGGEASSSRAQIDAKISAIERINTERKKLKKQSESLHDFLEQGVYSVETFLQRSRNISERISALDEDESRLRAEFAELEQSIDCQARLIPMMARAIDLYRASSDPAEKNSILKEVIDHVVYFRKIGGRWAPRYNFTLTIYPRYMKGPLV